ncbi:MAG: ADP-ribosylglycohydrolase family protein [Myxococcota bacterium]|jgi:ADP-ribosylglycohydrolase
MPRPVAKPLKKPKGPAQVSEAVFRSRARGALLGLAVGEALGVPVESRNVPSAPFPQLNDGPTVDMRGGGRFERRAGQVGWCSEMAFCVSEVLRTQRAYDVFEVAKAYARWAPHAEEVPEPTKQALEQVAEGKSPEYTGRRVWIEGQQRVRDNGVLGRSVPVGVFFARRQDLRVTASLDDACISHFDPLCQLAAATVNGVIGAAIATPKERLETPEVLKVAEAELSLAALTLGRRESDWVSIVKDAADWLRDDIRAAQDDDPMLYGPELHLFFPVPTLVRTTFRLAFWELFHAPSFESGVIDAVNRGGDADTHGAVVGALLGAVYGEEAIPPRWTEVVMESPGPSVGGPHWNVYHPRFLVTLAGLEPDPQEPAR